MPSDPREQDRGPRLSREEWITKFVNAAVRELRPGLERMVAVHAAREAWPTLQDESPRMAAKNWLATLPES